MFQEFHHPPKFHWILAAIPVFRNGTGLTVLDRGLLFFCFWFLVGLVNSSSEISEEYASPPFLPFDTFTLHSCGMVIYPARISTWWRKMKFLDMDQKSFIASPGIRKWVLRLRWKRPFWFSKKISSTFSSNWVIPYQGGCSQFLISSSKFDSSICDWKWIFHFLWGNITSFALSLFLSRFLMRPSFPTPQCLQPVRHPSKFSPRTKTYPRNYPGKTFFPNSWILDWSFAVKG